MITTGNCAFAVCPNLCHVHLLGHKANLPFAECWQENTWQNTGTRQKMHLPCATRENTWQQEVHIRGFSVCHSHMTNELSPIVDVLDLPTDKVAVSDQISGRGSQFLQVPSS